MISLREFFLKNLGLKGVSLLLAFLLWHQVASQKTVQRTISIPVEFVNMPPEMEISNDHPKRVDITLRSDRGGANIDQLTAVVDLKGAQPGFLEIPLTEQSISRPPGLEIIRIEPSKLALRLEVTRRAVVKIQPRITGSPAAGYEVTGVRVVPAQVRVSGPDSVIEKAGPAQTGDIDIAGRSSTFTQDTLVDLDDPRLRIDDAFSVTVVVTIEEKRRPVRIRGVQVKVIPAGTPSRLYTKKIDVEGSVPISFQGDLDPKMFQAVVDLTPVEARRDAYQLTPEIVSPEDYSEVFRLTGFKPETVKVRKDG